MEENTSEVAKYDLNLSLEQTLEKALRDVNKALGSVDKDDYGICKYCQQPIEKARLMARPTSSACVSCKMKLKAL
jgi:DnaK suppressor protein